MRSVLCRTVGRDNIIEVEQDQFEANNTELIA